MPNLLALTVWTIDALLGLPRVADPQISPDGRLCAYVVDGAVQVQPVASGAAVAIGKGSRPRWSPDGKKLAFLSSRSGGAQVYSYDVRAKSTARLTQAPSPVVTYSWAPDSGTVYFLAADPGPAPDPIVADTDYRYQRLYAGTKRLTNADRHVISFAISPDAKRAVVASAPTPRNRDTFHVDLYLLDLATLAERPLVTQEGRDADPSWSPDGKWIAFHSQAGSSNYFGARHVAVVGADGGKIRYVTEGQPYDAFRNANQFTWSADSRALIYTAGQSVEDFLVRTDLESSRAEVLARRISGAASFTPDLSRAVYLETSLEHPPEIVVLDKGAKRPLTHVYDRLAAYSRFRTEVVRWKSGDGLDVDGILWLPAGYKDGMRVPMLVELHGGPTGVVLHAFPTPRVYPTQVFLERGIAVFAPNFRGSVNYGAPFRLKNALSQGVGDYDDVMTGIDHLVARGIADPDHLGVMGWSYGGYLSGSVITQTQRFKAASIGAPATDWITYYGQSDGAREVLWTYFGGTPWEATESYNRHSSRGRLKEIRTPALLQVGSLDINHNGEIYQALVDQKVPVEYVVYPREGHGIAEPAHIRDLMERNLRWFTKWLQK